MYLRSVISSHLKCFSLRRWSTSNVVPAAAVIEDDEFLSKRLTSDPLMQSIQTCSSLSTLFPLVRSQLPQQKAEHIAAALLRACNIVRSCVYFHPIHMETYRKKLLAHPIFDLLCHLCEHRLLELNYEDHVNIMSALVKLDIRLSSSESPFLRHLFTQLSQTNFIEQLDLNLLNRFLIALVKKSNRHLCKSAPTPCSLRHFVPLPSVTDVQTDLRTFSPTAERNRSESQHNDDQMHHRDNASSRHRHSSVTTTAQHSHR